MVVELFVNVSVNSIVFDEKKLIMVVFVENWNMVNIFVLCLVICFLFLSWWVIVVFVLVFCKEVISFKFELFGMFMIGWSRGVSSLCVVLSVL